EWRNSMGTASGAGAPEADASAILGLFAQAVLIVSGIIALTVSARVAWVIRRNRQVIYVDNSDAVVRHFYDILRYLKFFKLEMDQHETALQFAHKVNQRTDFASRHLQMKEIAGIFSKARYSGHTISASERKDVERTLEYLDARMLGTAGRIRYLYYKYILAIV
ncbi:MAG: DUF4129 domain-containing protein, partial [Defluviitaleaceae bacterium]|nr:DUF4129 domain-containing protein [Defluviitaleaceae bacterium]